MTTLKQILEKVRYLDSLQNWQVRKCVKEWLQQKRTKYPRLNNYPDYATKIELVNYVEELTDWAIEREEYIELLEDLE